ncbi:MAG: LysR family transcriptional regulator [Burkholderiales bacterium]|nr:LysR family transcriptional regulator [Burkholderiales bacterium]
MPRTPVSPVLNRLRLRQVALVLAIARAGTLSAAAHEIGITQPAATKMLGELEDALGQRLFDRTGRVLVLNAAGQRTLLAFRGMRGTIEQLLRDLHELGEGTAGRIAVGSIMAASPTYLTRALADLKNRFPGLAATIEVGTSDRLMELLDDGALDVVIGRVPAAASGYRFDALADEAPAVICAPGHPLLAEPRIAFTHLRACSWVLQPAGNPLRDVVNREFEAKHAALPQGLLETASTMITIHLVMRTRMLAVLPTSVASGFARHGMVGVLRYRMRSRLTSYGSIVRDDRPLSPPARHFLALLHPRAATTW